MLLRALIDGRGCLAEAWLNRKGGSVGKLSLSKIACIVFVFWPATAIVSAAQTYIPLLVFDGTNGAGPTYMSLMDVLQISRLLAGDVKESGNDSPTRDLQMAADRIRPHTLCGPVVVPRQN